MSLLAPAQALSAAQPDRIWGPTRIDTAVKIVDRSFPAVASTVYLARSDVFADALAAGVLTDGPVLLVPPCGAAPRVVADAVARLDPEQVVALGGPAAVCDQMVDEVAGERETGRLWGVSRIGTAVAISQRAFPSTAAVVYLARSNDSPDAVAGGVLTDGPILLVPSAGAVPQEVLDEIRRISPAQVVALGGPAAVGDEVLGQAAGARLRSRLAGEDRIATAAAIAAAAFPETARAVYLARSDVFADAVAAGSLTDGPVLLVPSCGGLPDAVRDSIARSKPTTVYALGGTSAICDELLAEAAAAGPDRPYPDQSLLIPDTTKVLTDEQRAALVSYGPGGTLAFDAAAVAENSFDPGDVVVSEPTASAPAGLLRVVTDASSQDGQTVLTTEVADLTDAVHRGSMAGAVTLTPDQVTHSTPLPPGVSSSTVESSGLAASSVGPGWSYELDHYVLYDHDGDRSTTNDQVWADGSLDLGAVFVPEIDIDTRWAFPPVYVDRALFAVDVSEAASITLTAHYDDAWTASETLVAHTFRPITFTIGPVPVVIVPTLHIGIGADGLVDGTLTFGADQSASMRAGAEYRDGSGWHPVDERSFEATYRPPTFDARAEAREYVSGRVAADLYGVAGPFIDARLYARALAVTQPCLTADFYAGVTVDVGLAADVPGLDLPELDARVVEEEKSLGRWGGACETAPSGYQWSGSMTWDWDRTREQVDPNDPNSVVTVRDVFSGSAAIADGTVPSRDVWSDTFPATVTATYVHEHVWRYDGAEACVIVSEQRLEEGSGELIRYTDTGEWLLLAAAPVEYTRVEGCEAGPDGESYLTWDPAPLGEPVYDDGSDRWVLSGTIDVLPPGWTGHATLTYDLSAPPSTA